MRTMLKKRKMKESVRMLAVALEAPHFAQIPLDSLCPGKSH